MKSENALAPSLYGRDKYSDMPSLYSKSSLSVASVYVVSVLRRRNFVAGFRFASFNVSLLRRRGQGARGDRSRSVTA